MPSQIRFTEEEKKEDYKDILNMIRKNMSYSEISDTIGRSKQYICNVKKDLIKQGLITQKEIDEIKEQARLVKERKIDKKVLSYLKLGYNKNEIYKITKISPKDVNDSIERLISHGIDITNFKSITEIKRKARRHKIKKLLKKGYYITQISEETHIPRSSVSRVTDDLISEGVIKKNKVKSAATDVINKTEKRNNEIRKLLESGITPDEIMEKYNLCSTSIWNIQNDKKISYSPRKKKKEYDVIEIDNNLSELEILALNYLKKGYSYVAIRKAIGKEQAELMKMVKRLKKEKYITQTIIKEAQIGRKEEIRNKIKNLTMQGYSQVDILRTLNQEVEEVTTSYISRTILDFIETGEVSKEDIKRAFDDTGNSYKSIDAKVLSYLRQGLTVKEIIESDESGFLTESRTRRSKQRLIQSGEITENEIIKYQQKNAKEEKDKIYKEEEKIMWQYVKKEGLTNAEISEKLGLSYSYVSDRILSARKSKKLSLKDVYRIRKNALLKIEEEKQIEKSKNEIILNRILSNFKDAKINLIKYINDGIDNEKAFSLYFKFFQEMIKHNLRLSKKDLDLISYVVLYSKTYCSFEYASYVVDVYLKMNEVEDAEKFFNMFNADNKLDKDIFENEKNKIRSHRKAI